MKLLKSDSHLGLVASKLLEGIDLGDRAKAEGFFEECKKNLHLVRSKERALESKNTRMRTHKVVKFLEVIQALHRAFGVELSQNERAEGENLPDGTSRHHRTVDAIRRSKADHTGA